MIPRSDQSGFHKALVSLYGWPEHPQLAGFFFTLAMCIAVQLIWPKEWLGGRRAKG